MKLVTLNNDGSVAFEASKGFVVTALDEQTGKVRLLINCEYTQLPEFLAQLADEVYVAVAKQGLSDELFLSLMSSLMMDIVRANKGKVQQWQQK